MSKNVLVIAYHFPPDASSGTFRTLKFVKYLPQWGWNPIVLTVDPRHEPLEPMDPALVQQVPSGVKVIRTFAWSFWDLFIGRRTGKPASGIHKLVGCKIRQGGAFEKLKLWMRSLLLRTLFPDRCNGWYFFAVWAGWWAIRRHHVDVLYSSAPPYTGTLVGLTLSKLTGKPLVSDFRDPWAVNTYRQNREGQSIARQELWAQALERKVFMRSACVINISAELSSKAKNTVPESLRGKFATIHNGFDRDDFKTDSKSVAGDRFRVVYAGTFYEGSREPRNYLLALRLLADRHPKEFERIYTRFVGGMEWAEENAAWCNTLNLGEHVQFSAFLPHRENLKVLAEADLLLMIGSVKKSDTGTLPAKLFEYAASGRPILALVHEGESARFVRGYGLGRIANPEDPESIAAVLLATVKEIRDGTFPTEPDIEFLRRYDRRELTRQLAEVFDSVVCSRNA